MKKIRVKESVLKMRFEEIYGKYQQRKLSTHEAAELLGISERTFRRKKERFEGEGLEGLNDLRLHKRSPKRAEDQEVERIAKLYAERYRGLSIFMNLPRQSMVSSTAIRGQKR